jgi:hypothetical protein
MPQRARKKHPYLPRKKNLEGTQIGGYPSRDS